MTFSEIQTEINERLSYTSTAASTRVGRLINKIYREITTTVGLATSRHVATSVAVTIGNTDVTFTGVEKVERIWIEDAGGRPTILDEVLLGELRGVAIASSDKPQRYAIRRVGSNSVTIRLNARPATAYTIFADGTTEVADLSGSGEPAFPESFHDIIIEGVLKEEYQRLEKPQLSDRAEARFQRRLSDLRMFIAKSNYLDIYQGKSTASKPISAGSGGGSATLGQTAINITALWTFDREPSAPFAVTDTSAYVANLFSEGVGNIATDRLTGRDAPGTGESEQLTVGGGIEFTGSGGIQTSAFTGDVTKSAGGTVTAIGAGVIVTADIADDQVTYPKIQNVGANSALTRASTSSGDVGETALAASQLLGRGSSGDIAAIVLGSGLSMSATTLSASAATADDAQNILASQIFS